MKDNGYKNFSYVALGRIIYSVLIAIFFFIFAAILEPADYGEMGYLIAIAGTFWIISNFGLTQSVVVYRAKGDTSISNQLSFLGVITTSVASIILLFINEFAAFLCLGLSFFTLYQANLLGEKKYKKHFTNIVLRSVLTFILPFPLYFVLGIPGILLGLALGNIISGLWLVKFISFRTKSFQFLKNNYKVLINNFGVDASTNLVRSVDRLLVGTLFGFIFTGIFIFNMQVLLAIEILPKILYLFLLTEESSGKKHTKISYLVILASVLIAAIVIVFSPIVVEQIFPNYTEGIPALQILVITVIPVSLSSIITAKMQAIKSTKVGYSAIVSVSSLLILLGFLGNEFGLVGLSLAVVISSILSTIFLYFLYRLSERVYAKGKDRDY